MSEYFVLVENGERLKQWKKKNNLFWREKKTFLNGIEI
jgi:hypothetical protein